MENKSNGSLYEEIGKNYRFFLTWRYIIFWAYFVYLYGVMTITENLFNNTNFFVTGVFLIGAAFVSSILWIVEKRIREICHGLIEKGKKLETYENQAYSIIDGSRVVNKFTWSLITYSRAIDILAYISFLFMFSSGIILLQDKFVIREIGIYDIEWYSWIAILIFGLIAFRKIDPFFLKFYQYFAKSRFIRWICCFFPGDEKLRKLFEENKKTKNM